MLHHLGSLALVKVSAESIFGELSKLFTSLELPWKNVLSIMMDSCAVMRGPRAGLEKLIRDRLAPQLLDVDGDSCHYAHNAAKKFCSAFNGEVEKLLTDLHTDFKWCTEYKDLLADICLVLGTTRAIPKRYVPHRWLSVLDVTNGAVKLLKALTLFYFSFLEKDEKTIYDDLIKDIFRGVEEKGIQSIKTIISRLAKKTMTPEGKARKKRILDALFTHRPQTLLIMHLYSAVLPNLTAIIHSLLSEQHKLLDNFFGLFVDPNALAMEKKKLQLHKIQHKTSVVQQRSYLKCLDLDKKENLLSSSEVFIGVEAENLLKAKLQKRNIVSDDIRKSLMKKTKKAYVLCAKSLQAKMPLENPVLRVCSALDPTKRCTKETSQLLLYLPKIKFFPGLESNQFQTEVRSYNISQTLELDPMLPIDQWWKKLQECYPLLCQGALAMLSCFHGPLVESF